jgi:hypothetical protein
METQLITLSDIRDFKGISLNIAQEKELNPLILEAQDFDLRAFLGDSFYIALIEDFEASPSLATYSELWNGKKYTFNGLDYKFEGLRAVLVYHSWARFVALDGITSTPTGFVNKTTQYSERADPKAISRLVTQARSGATVHEERTRLFLDRHYSDFPLWRYAGRTTNFKNGVKMRQV